MMPIPFELTRPWLLLLMLPICGFIGFYFARSLSDFPRPQRIFSLLTRMTIVVLMVLSLSGLTFLDSTRDLFVVFLVDRSFSVGDEATDRATEFLETAIRQRGANQVAMLPFACEPWQMDQALSSPLKFDSAERPDSPAEANSLARPLSSQERPKRDGTNLAAAIETASGFVPSGYVPRLVLLSDGNETIGDALAAAARSRTPVYSVPLPSRSDPEVQVSAVEVPAEVQEGEPFYVDVTIHSTHDDEGLVELFRGDHKVLSEKHTLVSGENRLRFQQSIDRDRLAAYTVRISGLSSDTLLDNNADSALVYAAGKPRVLIIESDPNLIRELAYALEDEGIQVDIRPPQGMPGSLADLQNYECLVLSNVPATDMTNQQMTMVRTYVQQLGGGFLMLGGEQSFGLGGYYKSALEEILPVRSDFEKEKEKPSLAMVLSIDKSGSMDGDKMEMAKSAARAAVELLGRRDSVAVLAFDGDTYVISEMQAATNSGRISDEISRIDAGGGTAMYPSMEMAYEMLLSTSAKLKHMILLTDGVSTPGDFEGIAQLMASAKMTVSTVAVGEGSDVALLETIARVGKGRFYETNDPAQVPQIFAKETVTASKSAIDEQPFLPQVVRATHALGDIDMESAPFLLGYVMTRPKPTSEVILATERGDPLLAWWRYGLGMSAAFTSDAKTRWAAEWMTWPGYGKFWTQVIRQTMRKSDTRGIQVSVNQGDRRGEITVDAVNELGQFLNAVEVEMMVIEPDLKQVDATLRQTAPGQYGGDFLTPKSGAYHMEVTVKQAGEVLYRQSRGMMVGYSDELRIRPTNDDLLRRIADVSSGRYDATSSEIFEAAAESASRAVALWPWLLAAAALLLVLDVSLRRVDFSLL